MSRKIKQESIRTEGNKITQSQCNRFKFSKQEESNATGVKGTCTDRCHENYYSDNKRAVKFQKKNINVYLKAKFSITILINSSLFSHPHFFHDKEHNLIDVSTYVV